MINLNSDYTKQLQFLTSANASRGDILLKDPLLFSSFLKYRSNPSPFLQYIVKDDERLDFFTQMDQFFAGSLEKKFNPKVVDYMNQLTKIFLVNWWNGKNATEKQEIVNNLFQGVEINQQDQQPLISLAQRLYKPVNQENTDQVTLRLLNFAFTKHDDNLATFQNAGQSFIQNLTPGDLETLDRWYSRPLLLRRAQINSFLQKNGTMQHQQAAHNLLSGTSLPKNISNALNNIKKIIGVTSREATLITAHNELSPQVITDDIENSPKALPGKMVVEGLPLPIPSGDIPTPPTNELSPTIMNGSQDKLPQLVPGEVPAGAIAMGNSFQQYMAPNSINGSITGSLALPNKPPPSLAPMLSEDYEIIGKLGEGGQGAVYKVQEKQSSQPKQHKRPHKFAYKVIRFEEKTEEQKKKVKSAKELEDERKEQEKLKQERIRKAKIYHRFRIGSKRFRNGNIILPFEEYEREGGVDFAMPLATGKSLKEIIGSGTLTLRQAVQILYQVAKAIQLFQEEGKGYAHRDLKPANIIVQMTKSGLPKVSIIDLDMCEELKDLDGKKLFVSDKQTGTPGYFPPETMVQHPDFEKFKNKEGDPVHVTTDSSDLFSAITIFFETLGIKHKFSTIIESFFPYSAALGEADEQKEKGASVQAVNKILNAHDGKLVTQLEKNVSSSDVKGDKDLFNELKPLLRRGLAFDYKKRPKIDKFVNKLEEIMRSKGITIPRIGSNGSRRVSQKSNTVKYAAMAAAALIVPLILAYGYISDKGEQETRSKIQDAVTKTQAKTKQEVEKKYKEDDIVNEALKLKDKVKRIVENNQEIPEHIESTYKDFLKAKAEKAIKELNDRIAQNRTSDILPVNDGKNPYNTRFTSSFFDPITGGGFIVIRYQQYKKGEDGEIITETYKDKKDGDKIKTRKKVHEGQAIIPFSKVSTTNEIRATEHDLYLAKANKQASGEGSLQTYFYNSFYPFDSNSNTYNSQGAFADKENNLFRWSNKQRHSVEVKIDYSPNARRTYKKVTLPGGKDNWGNRVRDNRYFHYYNIPAKFVVKTTPDDHNK